jgi:hypothetical protein
MILFKVKRRENSNSFVTEGTVGTFSWSGLGLAAVDTLLSTGVNVRGVFFCILLVTSTITTGVSLKLEEIFT